VIIALIIVLFACLWPPYVIGQAIIFLPCGFFLLLLFLSFFPRLISAAADWMSTILPHTYIWQGGHHIGHWPTFLVMVALCNKADHYIFILFLSSSFFFLA